jgi:hypothetical protein
MGLSSTILRIPHCRKIGFPLTTDELLDSVSFKSDVMAEFHVGQFVATARTYPLINPAWLHLEKEGNLLHSQEIVNVANIHVRFWKHGWHLRLAGFCIVRRIKQNVSVHADIEPVIGWDFHRWLDIQVFAGDVSPDLADLFPIGIPN